MAKGKIVYTQVVNKEIEIPDEIIEISEKSWWDMTDAEYNKMCQFYEDMWKQQSDVCDRCGIYYEENGQDWVLEEY